MKNFKRILLSLAVAGAAFSSAGIASAELIPNASADASNYMMKTGYEQQLQGSWMASNGDVTVGIIFMNNMMGLNYNGATKYGTFTIEGSKLTMHVQDGQVQTWNFSLQGNQLNLDGMILTRVNLPGGNGMPDNNGWGGGNNNGGAWGNGGNNNGGAWGNGGNNNGGAWGNGGNNNGGAWGNGGNSNGGAWGNGGNNGGAWGNGGNNGGAWGNGGNNGGAPKGGTWDGDPNNPATVPPANGGAATPVDGRWVLNTPQGLLVYLLQNNNYIVTLNNQQIETGRYEFNPASHDFRYQILSGQNQGMTGTHKVYVQGNQLMFVAPNGNQMVFTRQ